MPDHANPTWISTDENIQLEPTQGLLSKFKSEKPIPDNIFAPLAFEKQKHILQVK